MIFTTTEKLHFVYYLLLGLLSLPLLTECSKIRLVGPSRCSGRVEVYHEDGWGSVCDDHWSITNAEVVCRELNCGTVLESKTSAFFGEGDGRIWLDDVKCTGTEQSILKCPHRSMGDNDCGHGEDAGVICSDYVRVVNGSNRCSGRVEVQDNGHWKKLCGDDRSGNNADVVCREINCGPSVAQDKVPYFGEGPKLENVKSNCFGNESSFSQCTRQETTDICPAATVVCKHSRPIRLMNGTGRCSGRMEIYHDGQWGTICDDRWGMQEATVVCQELSCGSALSIKYNAHFGRGQGQVWLDDVDCTGHEKSLSDCPHRGFGEHDCDHNEDASVICSVVSPLRLVNGTDRCSGRVEVRHDNQWGTVCDDEWDIKDAEVVCRSMDCGTAQSSKNSAFFGQGQGDIWLDDVTCFGNETSLIHCRHPTLGENNCGHGEDAGVVCSGIILLITLLLTLFTLVSRQCLK
ncbi:Deleted in malignant brain tumors 1 protein [Liparis tanakae]|uniref:Soluble scavenger receptor cysteine-rich domain-containing protein SSC5D n=1 Tax=Liparis tanakae TaxID=230148 RepID=A0A4Z2IXS3_9TELE|nr:Deleted in malignant brain tumors 1 protein [Liparis tanakae]